MSEPREVRDDEGMSWSCLPAFAGLGDDRLKEESARMSGSDRVTVVCTPSGGARSVRLDLSPDWEAMDDGALLSAIAKAGRT